jgi:hypothetical protein
VVSTSQVDSNDVSPTVAARIPGAFSVVARVTTILRAQAARSLLIAILTPVPELWRGGLVISVYAGVGLVAALVVCMWSLIDEGQRRERLVARADRWPHDRPFRLSTKPAVVAGVLMPLPLSVLLVWLVGRGAQALGLDPGVALGALSGLFVGLVCLRVRLAHALSIHEAETGEWLLVAGLGLRRRITVWRVRRSA